MLGEHITDDVELVYGATIREPAELIRIHVTDAGEMMTALDALEINVVVLRRPHPGDAAADEFHTESGLRPGGSSPRCQ
ncbi:hypothetical protein AB0L39_18510 [Streptomyces parvus]|uniref:hypothetical protein n=1 Tax=Streptomyces parvus TaxID=66428 RepID=UPI003418E4FD